MAAIHVEKFEEMFSQFIAAVPVANMPWEDSIGDWSELDCDKQDQLMNSTFLHPHSLLYPPSLQYRKTFLKFIIAELEKCSVDIIDIIYETYTGILAESETAGEQRTMAYKTYTISPDCRIVLSESPHIISCGTTGLCTWQAAQYLAEWCLDHSELFESRTVLELGSGLGLTGLVVSKMCRKCDVFLSDCHDHVLSALVQNVRRNINTGDGMDGRKDDRSISHFVEKPNIIFDTAGGLEVEGRVCVLNLDWESFDTWSLEKICGDVNLILASDVVFDTSIIPQLVGLLASLLIASPTEGGCENEEGRRKKENRAAIICSTIRNTETHQYFLQSCDKAGLRHTTVDASRKPRRIFFYDSSLPIILTLLTDTCVNLQEHFIYKYLWGHA